MWPESAAALGLDRFGAGGQQGITQQRVGGPSSVPSVDGEGAFLRQRLDPLAVEDDEPLARPFRVAAGRQFVRDLGDDPALGVGAPPPIRFLPVTLFNSR